MSDPRGADVDQGYVERKARDRALVLPIVGLILLVPPVASIFQIDSRIAGIPFTALYLFTVWAFLIIGAALLSRRLLGTDPPDTAVSAAETTGEFPDHMETPPSG